MTTAVLLMIVVALVAFTGCKQDTPAMSAEEAAERQLINDFAAGISAEDPGTGNLLDPSIGQLTIDYFNSPNSPIEIRREIATEMRNAELVARTDTYAMYKVHAASDIDPATTTEGKFWIVERDGQLVIRFTTPREE